MRLIDCMFFFFKQKTAYEMRISDWSSACALPIYDRHSGRAPFLEPDAKSQVTLRYENGKPVAATAIVVSTQHAKGYDQGEQEEIGRASCRERVCQYV